MISIHQKLPKIIAEFEFVVCRRKTDDFTQRIFTNATITLLRQSELMVLLCKLNLARGLLRIGKWAGHPISRREGYGFEFLLSSDCCHFNILWNRGGDFLVRSDLPSEYRRIFPSSWGNKCYGVLSLTAGKRFGITGKLVRDGVCWEANLITPFSTQKICLTAIGI